MKHEESVRIVPGADTAVLFMHGICGTPNHFRDLIPLEDLVPKAWSVYNVLLDGHGGSIEDFAHTSMEKWKKQVFVIFDQLCRTHEKIVIVGHSMGNLFAMQMAVQRPEKVAMLFMISPPMRPWIRLFGVKNLVKLAFGCLCEDIPLEAATKRVAGIHATPELWKYPLWIPRFLELFQEIYLTEKQIPQLSVPCIAWQCKHDELVSNFTCGVLKEYGKFRIHCLPDSTHFYYAPSDQTRVRKEFVKVCEKMKSRIA